MMWPLFAKLLGAVCVTLCGAAWGLGRAKSILMQVRLLEEMLRFLQCVESELEFRAQETPLLLHSAQKRHGFAPFRFLWKGFRQGRAFPGSWRSAWRRCARTLGCVPFPVPRWIPFALRWAVLVRWPLGRSAVNFAMHRPSFSAFWRKAERTPKTDRSCLLCWAPGWGPV